MQTRFAVTLAIVLGVLACTSITSARAEKPSKAAQVFGLDKLWQFEIELSAGEYEKMQPAPPKGPFGTRGPEKPAEKPATTDVHKSRGFGVVFPFARGSFNADGQTYSDVGIRYKGNASYLNSAKALKRSLKIEFDHYNDDADRFYGLRKLNLNSGAMDPTKGREAFSFAVFRQVGAPAPRTAFAEVRLTVPNKFDKELLGLFTVIEQVDKQFLKDRFKNDKGLLLKPEGLRGFEYLGENWDSYKPRYLPKREPTTSEAQHIIAFARLIHRADDQQFAQEIGSLLDIDLFLRFIAANALVSNLDSIFSTGHNFYMYLHPATNKVVFIPWDMDLSLAGFPMIGTPNQQMDLSLARPINGQNRLISRLFAIKEIDDKYQALLKELVASVFTKEALLRDVETIEATTRLPKENEAKALAARHEIGYGFGPLGVGALFIRVPDLRTFVEKRTASVNAQIAGKSKGFVPPNLGFFGARGPKPLGPIAPPAALEQLKLSAEQNRQIGELQKDVDAQLEKLLTPQQKQRLREIRERGQP